MKFPEQFRYNPTNPMFHSREGDSFGAFQISGRQANGRSLAIIAADGLETGWDHVSVSLPDSPAKQPSWEEMCIVKRLFWDESECVVQFHPPEADYVNTHNGVLHLFRWTRGEFPRPPKICV